MNIKFLEALTLILITLKLTGLAVISWWVVALPFIFKGLLHIIGIVLVGRFISKGGNLEKTFGTKVGRWKYIFEDMGRVNDDK